MFLPQSGGGPLFCMNIAARAVHSNILTVPAGAQGLGGDGFAFMRVVEQTSPGSYKISLGGRLLEARSNLVFEPGTFLRVEIRTLAGQVQLVPEFTKPQALPQLFRFTEGSFQAGDIPQRLAQNLAALGLPVDGVSGRLFSMMQQLGLRFDGRRMRRAYRIASQFPGRESQAAEVALMLLEKGVEADSVMVASLLSMMLGDGGGFRHHQQEHPWEDTTFQEKVVSGGPAEDFGGLQRLVEELYGCSVASLGGASLQVSSLQGSSLKTQSVKEGLLTMVNHIATGTLHWLVVPFSLPLEAKGNELLGNIRVLLNLDSKKLLKICITAQSPSSQYAFIVYYGKNLVKAVEYAPGGEGWQRALEVLFPGVPVVCRPVEGMGLFCDPSHELASCNLEA